MIKCHFLLLTMFSDFNPSDFRFFVYFAGNSCWKFGSRSLYWLLCDYTLLSRVFLVIQSLVWGVSNVLFWLCHLTPNTPLIQLWCARSKLNMDEICSLNIHLWYVDIPHKVLLKSLHAQRRSFLLLNLQFDTKIPLSMK